MICIIFDTENVTKAKENLSRLQLLLAIQYSTLSNFKVDTRVPAGNMAKVLGKDIWPP